MKELTKAEEQVMQALWKIEKGVVHDVIAELPDPKPAYNTVSTIIRILENKGFITHESVGRTHIYEPLVERESYTSSYFNQFLNRYFDNSFQRLTSFFARKEQMSLTDLEEVKQLIEVEIQKKRGGKL